MCTHDLAKERGSQGELLNGTLKTAEESMLTDPMDPAGLCTGAMQAQRKSTAMT
jgi:hypothetical protein